MSIVYYKNARLIDPATDQDYRGTLITVGDKIMDLGPETEKLEGTETNKFETIDCGDRILAPGLIDMRAHKFERGAALAGGITTVCLTQNKPVEDQKKSFSPDILYLSDNHRGTGSIPSGNLPIKLMSENTSTTDGLAHFGPVSVRLGLEGIPASIETDMIKEGIILSREKDIHVHFNLVSLRESVDLIRAAKDRKYQISAATAPQYLYLNHGELEGHNTAAKYFPPLRSEEDRLALIMGVKDGTIDTLVSDHSPCSVFEKRQTFASAKAGVAGFETLLPVCLSFVHSNQFSLMTLLKALTLSPAQHLGLGSGRLAPGAPANLVIFDPDKPRRIDQSQLKTSGSNLLQEKLLVQGEVWRTIVQGQTAYQSSFNKKAL